MSKKKWLDRTLIIDPDTGEQNTRVTINNENIPQDEMPEFKKEVISMLKRASPSGQIELMRNIADGLDDNYPEKKAAIAELNEALAASDDMRQLYHIEKASGILEHAKVREAAISVREEALLKSKIAKNAGIKSGEKRSEISVDNKEWVHSEAQKLLNEGRSTRDIVGIIHKKIKKEIEGRYGDSERDYPGETTPKPGTIRIWTKEIRQRRKV